MSATTDLNTGAKMPMLGLGTWTAWKSKPGETQAAVETAIDAGYRHIDCAYVYGNEDEVGEAIQRKIKEGKVRREDLFITTKLWITCFRQVDKFCNISLSNLKLNYVDLYLMHWPFALKFTTNDEFFPMADGKLKYDEEIHYTEVWKEMEKLQKDGRAKAIGISNFNEYQLKRLLKDATITPAVHQYEIHPYLDQKDLLELCQSKRIVVTGYGSFGSPARPWTKPNDPKLLEDPRLKKIADKYSKSVAQVILRFLLQFGIVVIPKSSTPSRIVSNSQIFDFKLSEEEMTAIRSENRDWRAFNGNEFDGLVSMRMYFPFKDNYTE